MWFASALKGASSIAVAPHYEYRLVVGLIDSVSFPVPFSVFVSYL
jgi:hypothetical protein